jgi:hypothetical protein
MSEPSPPRAGFNLIDAARQVRAWVKNGLVGWPCALRVEKEFSDLNPMRQAPLERICWDEAWRRSVGLLRPEDV